MLESRSLRFTDFTPLSVRLTTSGCEGGVGTPCEESGAGRSRSAKREAKREAGGERREARTMRAKKAEVPSRRTRASRLPPPASLLQSLEQRVVARRCRGGLYEPLHGRTGRRLV